MEDDAIDHGPQSWQRGLQRGSFHRSEPGERWSIMDSPLARAEPLARLQRGNQHRTPELDVISAAFFRKEWEQSFMATLADLSLDELSIDTLRLLAVDEVEKANSGHPGAPLGCAPIAYLLFHKIMKHNPANSKWADRDRFVLSNGHASALLYGTLFLSGYKVTIDDLQGFRQWHSRTPGHPEYGDTDGVEVTTGPLGQGLAMAVGMAIAEKHLGAVYNRPGYEIVNHHTYVLCGDGDLMEGVSHEACALAGTLGAGQADRVLRRQPDLARRSHGAELQRRRAGALRSLSLAYAASGRRQRFERRLRLRLKRPRRRPDKPSLIAVRTVIGYGSPKAGTNKVHGEALGAADTAATKKFYGFPEDQSFYVPDDALKNWRKAVDRGATAEAEWQASLRALRGGVSRPGGRVRSDPERSAQERTGRSRFPLSPSTRSRPRATLAERS